ncbi:MAG: hypothetical protein EU547_05550 [Promethearchaeota archaeon]|nr:MAG: hypothetical protein EU547_05550 [Candidatus Lokiarchaeota archaeon]
MNYVANRKVYEKKLRCSECQERIYDPLLAFQSDLRFGFSLCKKCYKKHLKEKEFDKELSPIISI